MTAFSLHVVSKYNFLQLDYYNKALKATGFKYSHQFVHDCHTE